jgi:Aldehyde dehydrogenase family
VLRPQQINASDRGRLIWRIADLIEEHGDELAMLETLDNGKPYGVARVADVPLAADLFRYMAGWTTKDRGHDGADLGAAGAGRVSGLHAARAGWRRRSDHPVELPAAGFGGRAALEEFTELRWITVQQLPRHYPI